jgi:sporulation protein YlmC with PRC-barrel domain
MAQIFASRLRGMDVLTDKGMRIGRLHDMTVDEEKGKIISLVVRPLVRERLEKLPKDPDGNVLIPFNLVMAMREYIVVSEQALAIQQLKGKL